MGILYATTELPMLTTNHIVKNFYLKTLQFCDRTVVENLKSKLKNLEVAPGEGACFFVKQTVNKPEFIG